MLLILSTIFLKIHSLTPSFYILQL